MNDSVRAHALAVLPPKLPSNWPKNYKNHGGENPHVHQENMEG